jgi:hypothetical protein
MRPVQLVPRICSGGRASTSVTFGPRICSGGGDDVVVRAGALLQRRRGVKKMVLMITDSGVATGVGGRRRFHDCAYEEDDEAGVDSEEELLSDGAATVGEGEI